MDVTETRIPQKAMSRVRRTIFNDMIGLIISTVIAEKQTRTVRSMLGRLQMLTDWPNYIYGKPFYYLLSCKIDILYIISDI